MPAQSIARFSLRPSKTSRAVLAQKYLLDRFSPSRIADDRKPIPFAADERRFVEAAAENRLEPAEPDKRFWKRCCDSAPPSSDSCGADCGCSLGFVAQAGHLRLTWIPRTCFDETFADWKEPGGERNEQQAP